LRDVTREQRRVTLNHLLKTATHAWHGVKLQQPDWRPCSHSLAFSADRPEQQLRLYLILNAYWEPLDFELPPVANGAGPWRRWIDTALESPHDIVEWHTSPVVQENTYRAQPRSVVVLGAGSANENYPWPFSGSDVEKQEEK
jgi:glycogen operon protein